MINEPCGYIYIPINIKKKSFWEELPYQFSNRSGSTRMAVAKPKGHIFVDVHKGFDGFKVAMIPIVYEVPLKRKYFAGLAPLQYNLIDLISRALKFSLKCSASEHLYRAMEKHIPINYSFVCWFYYIFFFFLNGIHSLRVRCIIF